MVEENRSLKEEVECLKQTVFEYETMNVKRDEEMKIERIY